MSSRRAPRWRDVSPAWATPAVVGLGIAAFAGLLYLTRGLDFYYDEWDFVLGAPHWTLGDYFFPHAEHWSTVPSMIYEALFLLFGARTYLPFMAVLLAMHVAIAFLLYVFIRRRQGALLGLVTAAAFLFLGRGAENLMWAFQIGFLGSVMFGLAAWVLLDEPSSSPRLYLPAAAVCLLLSVMSSGVGLFFLPVIAIELQLDRGRRRWLIVLAPAVAAYLVWFLVIGRAHSIVHRSPYSLEAIRSLATYVPFGIGAAVIGLFGLALVYSEIGLAALAALVVAAWAPPRPLPGPRVWAAGAGILAQYVLIGLVRAQYGDVEAGSGRYVYIAAVFLLVMISEAVGGLPWRGVWRALLIAVATVAVVWSGYHLIPYAHERNEIAARQRVELQALWAVRDAPSLDRQAIVEPKLMPQVSVKAYLEARRIQGSTAPDVPFAGLASLPADDVNRELVQVLYWQVASTSLPLTGTGCAQLDPALGYMDVSAADGQTVTIASPFPGPARVYAWAFGGAPPADKPVAAIDIPPSERLQVVMPNTGHSLMWHVRTYPPTYANAMACVS